MAPTGQGGVFSLLTEPAAPDTPADVGLVVPDLSLIPDEPPEELFYHHKVKMSRAIRDLWASREIIYTLAERDFRAQYKQATLGMLWALLTPVATLITLMIVFSRVHLFEEKAIPYGLYAYTGILCWTFFAGALGSGGNALLSNKLLMAKTQFPRECFVLENMATTAINTVLSWIPLVVLFVIYGRAPALATVWTPMLMLIEVAFAAGITLAVSSLIIQARDLAQVLPIVLSLGIFATPVIWPFRYIPNHFHVYGGYYIDHHWVGGFYINLQIVYGFFNPLGPVINNVRLTMLLGQWPTPGPLVAAVIGTILYCYVGYRIFKRFEVNFADIA
jgi:ABC-type polysaccharide/polyol phosphate export permease